jgi:hypothetical protein
MQIPENKNLNIKTGKVNKLKGGLSGVDHKDQRRLCQTVDSSKRLINLCSHSSKALGLQFFKNLVC